MPRRAVVAIALTLVLALLPAVASSPTDEVSAQGDAELAWIELPSDRQLFGHVALYDDSADRMLLHGGEFDVNEPPREDRQLALGRGSWTAYAPTGEPPESRHGGVLRASAAVLDADERVALVACDCANGGSHLLDLANDSWSRAPAGGDHSRSNVLLAYDPVGDQAILYGGYERSLSPILQSGMAYDMSADRSGWSDLPDAPFKLVNQAVAYAPASRHVLAFGGKDAEGYASDALWRLDVARLGHEDAWEDIGPSVGTGPRPSSRMGATLTVDPESSVAVLFGGYSPDGERSDAWLLDYSEPDRPSWQMLVAGPGPGPAPRAGHSGIWDSKRGRVIVYGGVAAGRDVRVWDDSWALSDASSIPHSVHLPVAKRSAP